MVDDFTSTLLVTLGLTCYQVEGLVSSLQQASKPNLESFSLWFKMWVYSPCTTGIFFDGGSQVEEKRTPLQLRMDELAQKLSVLSFGVIGVICVIGVLQSRSWLEMFTIGGKSAYS